MAPGSAAPESHWPPRSPREALLSSPGGRAKYQRMLSRTSPSPSPKRSARPISSRSVHTVAFQMEEDGEEDEETLQLKLQEIQARLRLKKLQKAKENSSVELEEPNAKTSRMDPAARATGRPRTEIRPANDTEDRALSRHANTVEVPASPVRKPPDPKILASPSKLLGIDKGLTAKDISLKRAPSFKNRHGAAATHPPQNASGKHSSRPLTFNERLSNARSEAAIQAERQERIQRLRTNAFGIGHDEMEKFKANAVEIPNEPLQPPMYSREEIMSQGGQNTGSSGEDHSAAPAQTEHRKPRLSKTESEQQKSAEKQAKIDAKQTPSFESYSCLHLSRRILPHSELSRQISGMKVFNLADLLKVVKSPDYCLPDIEQDIVVFGIVAKKSEPRAHKQSAAPSGNGDHAKYMVINIVDLKLEIDLFLFKSGFSRFWKLSEGTVVAILNPNIMPPPPGRQDTGRFSLVINSDADTILEIGSARDLGFCQSLKKDGSLCGAWVNKKKTNFCEFHSNEALRKQRSKRAEINGKAFGGWGSRKPAFKEYSSKSHDGKPGNYDRDTQSHWYTMKSQSAADLLDGKDQQMTQRKERSEFLKRSLEAKEREREIMKKLGRTGDAAGKEYMQRAGQFQDADAPNLGTTEHIEAPVAATAASLGLLGKQQAVHLSPIKRKRVGASQSSSISSGTMSGFGWGTSLKDKLSKMKEGEKLRKEEDAPARKKTRFVTEKGIREAGRDSLGLEMVERQVTFDNDDDDELIIV
ncbi:hypothetical protein S40285_08490 [Stachybotrys chlorohalonatus IBT 40285]|uniref:Uncharacterized protein n=1 Tax=Stachybotrys chlorohalonatus (strain IBT 40285) TaxID=1283841 RepID=A0A084QIB2_STAC4|nr:hypothetical protein S40285_08490 [Stachybotrys chlorohalonata IBT 40285]